MFGVSPDTTMERIAESCGHLIPIHFLFGPSAVLKPQHEGRLPAPICDKMLTNLFRPRCIHILLCSVRVLSACVSMYQCTCVYLRNCAPPCPRPYVPTHIYTCMYVYPCLDGSMYPCIRVCMFFCTSQNIPEKKRLRDPGSWLPASLKASSARKSRRQFCGWTVPVSVGHNRNC